MSKSLKVESSFLENAKNEFLKMFAEGKFNDGNIVFNRKFVGETNKKAKISIEKIAWDKMKALVEEFSSEVAWHGIARRGDKDGEYIIDDIIIYPQTVSGVTVTTDQIEYQTWLYEQPDEVFNNIRMQGHSHVNMGTSPSSVDTNYYEGIVDQMTDEMFYIFMILNKKGERFVNIYDKKDNVLYESKDVTITILVDPEDPVEVMLAEAKEKIKKEIPKPTISKYCFQGNYNYGKGGSGFSKNNNLKPNKPIKTPQETFPGMTRELYEDIMADPYGFY